MSYTFKYYFFLRKTASTKSSKLKPLYLRLQYGKERKDVSIKRKAPVDDFDSDTQRVSRSSQYSSVNIVLSAIETEIEKMSLNIDQEKDFQLDRFVKKLFLTHSNKGILELFTEHNEKMESLVGSEYSKNTLKKYKTGYRNLKRFLDGKDIPCYEIDIDFIEDYDYHLRIKRGCKHNTTLKYIFQFRKIVRLAIKERLLKVNPFLEYNKTYREKTPTYLTSKELKRIEESSFEIDRIENVRQLFLLACYTGLSYSDLMKLSPEDLVEDEDGQWFIIQPRTKTQEEAMVMILDKAKDLLFQYIEGNLNKLSNQKFNAYLKEVADLCGIKKNVTVHVARHTFATTVTLAKGVPLETVQHMMGHKDLRSTQHYARITTSKVKREMSKIN